MDEGFVAGKQNRFRWVRTANTKTIFAGVVLPIRMTLWGAPSYDGYRCEPCGLVIFSYDGSNKPRYDTPISPQTGISFED